MSDILKIQDIINYQFKDTSLLKEALTHPSMRQYKKNCKTYERLEFLGDSIIDFVIADLLFSKFTDRNEGYLSQFRSNLVSNKVLSEIAKKLQIHDFIIISDGERAAKGQFNLSNLENTMEALIGAIYKDAGYNTIKDIIIDLWTPYLDQNNLRVNYKSQLQDLVQSKGFPHPTYKLLDIVNPGHNPTIVARVTLSNGMQKTSSGPSKKEAEASAAKMMLEDFKKEFDK